MARLGGMGLLAGYLLLLPVPSQAAAIAVKDASGRDITIADPTRIVSVGGSITEILYALGLGGRVVAVDSTSLYPPEALGQKPNVGYMRQLSPEGVLGVAPSLILALEGSGPKDAVAVLQAANVPFVTVPDRFNAAGIVEKIHTVAKAAGVPARGECLADAVQSDLDALGELQAKISKPKRVMFVLSLVGGRAMVAGRGTAADGILNLAGAANAITEYEGYKTIDDEAVIAAKPDAILVMQRGREALTADAVFGLPSFAATPAGQTKTFVAMDGLYLLGFGPRTAAAARDLAAALYPGQSDAALPSEGKAAIAACAQ
jgi:iron complex transport system substrate-binding protein